MRTPTGGLYAGYASFQTRKHPLTVPIREHTRYNKIIEANVHLIQCTIRNLILQSEPARTISDMRALKCWMASSRLCCSLSLSISLVCSDRALCTSLSLSLRLASMRACRSSSFSASASTFYTTQRHFYHRMFHDIIGSNLSTSKLPWLCRDKSGFCPVLKTRTQ